MLLVFKQDFEREDKYIYIVLIYISYFRDEYFESRNGSLKGALGSLVTKAPRGSRLET